MTKPKSVRIVWAEDGLDVETDPDTPVRPPKCDMRGGIITNYRSEQIKIVGTYRFTDEHCGAELFAIDPEEGRPPKKLSWIISRLLPGASIVVNNRMKKTELHLEADGPKILGKAILMPEKTAVLTWEPLGTVKITGEGC